jgi:hypothetical protein
VRVEYVKADNIKKLLYRAEAIVVDRVSSPW